MEFIEFTAKTVSDAITEACQKFGIPSSKLEYEVLEEGSTGFLGIGAKAAKIKARVKEEEKTIDMVAKDFLTEVFKAMNLPVVLNIKYDDIERILDRVLMVKGGVLAVNTDVEKIRENGNTVENLFREVFSNVC